MRVAYITDTWTYDRHWKLLTKFLDQYGYDKFVNFEFFTAQNEEYASDTEYGQKELVPELNNGNFDAIIVSGNNALVATLLTKKPQGISKYRGKITNVEHLNAPVYAAISVGNVSREPHLAHDFEHDLSFIKSSLLGNEAGQLPIEIIDIINPEQLRDVICTFHNKRISYDFEATSLDRDTAEVTIWTACEGKVDGKYRVYFWAGYDKLIPLHDDETHAEFKHEFKNFFRHIDRIAWNHSYDDWLSETWLGEAFPFSKVDVMFEKWACETARPHGLKHAVGKFGGFPNYDSELDQKFTEIKQRRGRVLTNPEDLECLECFGLSPDMSKSGKPVWPEGIDKGLAGFALIEMEILRKYACLDAAYTYFLHEIFSEIIEEEGLQESVDIRHAISYECLRAEQRGELLDVKTNRAFSRQLENISNQVKEELNDAVVQLGFEDFNPDSPDQLRNLLYGECKPVPVLNRRRLYYMFDRESVDEICDEVEEIIYGDFSEVKQMLINEEFDPSCIHDMFYEAIEEAGIADDIQKQWEYFSNKNPKAELEDWLFTEKLLGTGGLMFDPPALTKKGAASTSKISLLDLSEIHDNKILSLVLMWRKSSKLKKDFIDKIYKCVNKDGLISTSYNPTGTIAGRLSSSGNYNAQNFPKKVRGQIIAHDDYMFFELDLKNAEVFTLAAFTQDPYLIEAVNSTDVHKTVASKMFGVPIEEVTDQQRQFGKVAVFLSVYGGGPDKLAKAMRVKVSHATQVQQGLLQQFNVMSDWFQSQKDLAAQDPYYVRTAFGTRISTRDILSSDNKIKSHIERVSVNAPIQGSAGELNLLYIIRAMKRARELGWALPLNEKGTSLFMFNNTVHDSIRFEVHKSLIWKDKDGKICGPAFDMMYDIIYNQPIGNEIMDRIQFKADFELNKAWSGAPNLKDALGKDSFRWDLIDESKVDKADFDDDEV